MKRTISLILSVIMLLGVLPLSAFASDWGEGDTLEDALSELKVAYHDNWLDWLTLPGLGVINQRYAYFLFDNERTGTLDEHPAYCIDPTKGGAYQIVQNVGPNDDGSNTATYIRGERVGDTRYLSILMNGYPHNKYTGLGLQSDEEGYYATKVALWMYIRGNDATKLAINPKYGDSDPVALRVYNAAINIYHNGMKGSGILAEPSIKMTGKPAAVATLDSADEYYVQVIDILASGWVGTDGSGSGPIQLTWGSAPPAGTIVLGSSGEDITSTLLVTTKADNGYRGTATIKYPASGVDPETFVMPTIFASAIVPNDEIYIAYAKVDKDRYQRYLVERDPKAEVTVSFISQIYNIPDGDIPDGTTLRIRKVQTGTNTPLAGAIFEVKDPEGKVIYSGATPDTGIIDLPLAVVGNYTVTEKTPPQYHLPATTQTQSVTVKYNELTEVTFANDPYGTLRVLKRDATNGAPLSGATIQIKHIKTGATYSATTASSGTVVFDQLPVGAYEIVELSAPNGYELDASKHTVNVTSLKDGEVSYSLTNKAKAGLRIYKFDRQTMTPIAGVTFEVWKDDEFYGSYVTDSWGEITITNLPSGTYTAKEVATIEPYVLDPTVQWIEITAGQGHISELVFLNLLKPGIRLIKLDSQTPEPLPNARYEIALVGGTYRNEFVTDQNGEIDLSGLEPGAYTVKELAAPNGYLIDDNIRIVQINPGENAQFVFTDTKKPSFELLKYDPINDKFLGGATFRIARIADGSRYLDRITDVNGRIRIDDLDSGIYSVQEIAAPSGYVLDPTEYHVELFPGKVSQIVVENIKKPSLIVWKYDEQTAKPLPNTEFSIAKKGGSVIYEGLTNSEGFIQLDSLDEGWYTVTEMAPPPGYLNSVPASRDVYLEPGKVIEVKFDNLRCPTLTVLKQDSITHDPIKNVRMNVKFSPNVNFSGGVVDLGNYITDESGRILLDNNLQSGWYRVTELEAASGYILKEPIVQDIFLRGGEDKTLYFENIPKSALIIRKTGLDGQPVSGATFTVKYLAGTSGSGGTLIKTAVTSVNGTITLTGLEPGTYVVEETVPAPGYQLSNPAVQTAFITDDDQCVVELVFSNPKMGQLILQKRSSAANHLPIAGVTFKVTDSSGAVIGPNNGLYVTDETGTVIIGEFLPIGSTIVVTEVSGPEEYNLDAPPQTVKIMENTTHTLTFYNSPKSGLQIIKTAVGSKAGLKDAHFRIVKANGEVVGDYVTDKDGIIIVPNLEPGWYKAYETKAPDGYQLDDTPKDFLITGDQFVRLDFENKPIGGLEILKLDENSRTPIPNTEFAISKMNGERISANTYITNDQGLIRVPGLDDGWYTVTEVKAAKGYILDPTPHNIEVKGGVATLRLTNVKSSSILLHKIDSVTGRGIYGVVFLLSDENRRPVGEYITDQDGFIWLDGSLQDGKYFLREVQPAEGYLNDTQVKTIYITGGKTTEITWKNTPSKGQIVITKLSYDYNPITNLPENSPLAGATFEVRNLSGNLVETIVSDSRGIAATRPLTPGVYVVTETSPPPYYTGTDKELIAQVKHDGDIVRFTVYNKSINIGVTVDKKGNNQVQAGQTMRYDLYNVGNTSSTQLQSFFLHDRLPTDAVRITKLFTGTWNQRLNYSVYFKTNYKDYRVLAAGLQSHINYELSLHPNVLGLAAGEYVTDVRWEFGTVNSGFKEVENPFMFVQVLNGLTNGYQIVNRADVGGKYLNEWQTARTTWHTTLTGNPSPLPRTGY